MKHQKITSLTPRSKSKVSSIPSEDIAGRTGFKTSPTKAMPKKSHDQRNFEELRQDIPMSSISRPRPDSVPESSTMRMHDNSRMNSTRSTMSDRHNESASSIPIFCNTNSPSFHPSSFIPLVPTLGSHVSVPVDTGSSMMPSVAILPVHSFYPSTISYPGLERRIALIPSSGFRVPSKCFSAPEIPSLESSYPFFAVHRVSNFPQAHLHVPTSHPIPHYSGNQTYFYDASSQNLVWNSADYGTRPHTMEVYYAP